MCFFFVMKKNSNWKKLRQILMSFVIASVDFEWMKRLENNFLMWVHAEPRLLVHRVSLVAKNPLSCRSDQVDRIYYQKLFLNCCTRRARNEWDIDNNDENEKKKNLSCVLSVHGAQANNRWTSLTKWKILNLCKWSMLTGYPSLLLFLSRARGSIWEERT